SRASDILQGLEPPYRKVFDLAHRNGDKVAVCTAATCRFLLEAPPLNCVDRGGGKHMKSHGAFYMLNFRKVRSMKLTLQRLRTLRVVDANDRKCAACGHSVRPPLLTVLDASQGPEQVAGTGRHYQVSSWRDGRGT
ncbi:MAG: hypothetical protein J0H16_00105, partial [Alicycliphilus denitrificans]|nr:hypothetical protein [Alicycliphilus denitrificans]